MAPDEGLIAERDRLTGEHLAKRPPWWRVFARRHWRARLRELRAMDVSTMAAMLRSIYTPESVAALAFESSPMLSLVKKQQNAAVEHLIKPIAVATVDPADDGLAMGYSIESLRMYRARRRIGDVTLNGHPVDDLPLVRDEPRGMMLRRRPVHQLVTLEPPILACREDPRGLVRPLDVGEDEPAIDMETDE